MYEYDVLAFIGRFQPFHNGHKAVVDTALRRAKKVAIIIGSDQQARSARNPFTTKERIEMISAVYPDEVAAHRIFFCPQVDHTYNMARWTAGVQSSVMAVANTPFTPDPVRIGLIGHSKDQSSFYLKAFPTWENIEVPNFNNLNATNLRQMYFHGHWDSQSEAWKMPAPVRNYLRLWQQKDVAYTSLVEEHEFIADYKRQFVRPSDVEIGAWLREKTSAYPEHRDAFAAFADAFCPKYPPTFYTADAIVVQSGHVLLIQRGAQPGKGLWAIPGGFVNQYETAREAAIRELKEETKISVPTETLYRCVNSWRVFEDPYRSLRGRTVTTAFRIELRPDTVLPKLKGSDDAVKARWVPISQLRREALFEDHYDILEHMVPF